MTKQNRRFEQSGGRFLAAAGWRIRGRNAVKLTLRRDDDGAEHNRVKRFEVLRVEKPEADPFASASDSVGQAFEPDCQPGKADLLDEAGGVTA